MTIFALKFYIDGYRESVSPHHHHIERCRKLIKIGIIHLELIGEHTWRPAGERLNKILERDMI